MEDNDAEHCDGMLVAGNEPGVVRQVLLDAPICLRPKVVMCSNCGKIEKLILQHGHGSIDAHHGRLILW